MAEVDTVQTQTPVPEAPAEAPAQPAAGPGAPLPPKRSKKKDKKKMVKRAVVIGVVAALVAGAGVSLYSFLHKSEDQGEIMSQPAARGDIQSKVSGSGNAKAKESVAITLPKGSTVREVFVTQGQTVAMGDPLYTAYSQTAEKELSDAQKALNDLFKDMEGMQGGTVRAPFAGKIMEAQQFYPGQSVSKGEKIATLVNDKKLKLALYYSYAYEHNVKVGQKVNVSIPAVMGNFDGKVEKINKVRYISPEGAVHFEVIVVFDNPGTLTAEMEASAILTAADGTELYPYQNGKTEFYESREVKSGGAGTVISTGNLINYADVKAGESLLQLDASEMDKQVEEAQKLVNEKMEEMSKFNAVSPIDGTVLSCTVNSGDEIKEDVTAVIVSNNTTMQVIINVDDRNIAFIKPGNMVELNWQGNTFMGEVTKIDMGKAEAGQGMTQYPVTLNVDNPDGSLMDGAWLDYSFVTSESLDCIMVPTSCVQYFSDKDGNRQSVVFVQRDSRPEDVPELELPTFGPEERRRFPAEDEGYYPVIVETGLSDPQNVEIVSGLEEGDNVFVNYMVTEGAGSW